MLRWWSNTIMKMNLFSKSMIFFFPILSDSSHLYIYIYISVCVCMCVCVYVCVCVCKNHVHCRKIVTASIFVQWSPVNNKVDDIGRTIGLSA